MSDTIKAWEERQESGYKKTEEEMLPNVLDLIDNFELLSLDEKVQFIRYYRKKGLL